MGKRGRRGLVEVRVLVFHWGGRQEDRGQGALMIRAAVHACSCWRGKPPSPYTRKCWYRLKNSVSF